MVFGRQNMSKTHKAEFRKTLQNIGHGDKIKGRRFENPFQKQSKIMKNQMFFGSTILAPFWKDFGRVSELQNQ